MTDKPPDPYQKLTLRIQQLVSEGVYDEITINIRTLEIVAKVSKRREGMAIKIEAPTTRPIGENGLPEGWERLPNNSTLNHEEEAYVFGDDIWVYVDGGDKLKARYLGDGTYGVIHHEKTLDPKQD